MKKAIAWVLGIVMCLFLCACFSTENDYTDDDMVSVTEETVNIESSVEEDLEEADVIEQTQTETETESEKVQVEEETPETTKTTVIKKAGETAVTDEEAPTVPEETLLNETAAELEENAVVEPSTSLETEDIPAAEPEITEQHPTEAANENAFDELPEDNYAPVENKGQNYVANTNTKKFHYRTCSSASDIKESNRWDFYGSRDELINMGYVPCKRCCP